MKIFGWLGIHLFLVHTVNVVSCKPLYLWRQVYLRKGHQDNVDLQLTAQLRYICLSLAPFSFVLCTLIGNGCAGRRHRAPQFTAWDLCLLPLVTGVHSSWHFCFMLANRKGWCYSWRVTLFWQLAWFFWLKNVWTHGSLWQPKAVSTHNCIMDSKPQNSYSSKPQSFIGFGDWLFHASSLPVIPTSF